MAVINRPPPEMRPRIRRAGTVFIVAGSGALFYCLLNLATSQREDFVGASLLIVIGALTFYYGYE